jgi:sec-independent protein translocase protein TatA
MFEGLFQPMHLLLIVGIALLVFGPKKLPELGKGIGEGIRGFKSAMKAEDEKAISATNSASHDQSLVKDWLMGLSSEILFILVLALLVLGPKKVQTLLGGLARAKAEFEEMSRGFRSQLSSELDAREQARETGTPQELTGGQWIIQGSSVSELRIRPQAQPRTKLPFCGSPGRAYSEDLPE